MAAHFPYSFAQLSFFLQNPPNLNLAKISSSMANAEAEALDFEPEEDDLMDEDVGDGSPNRATAPRLKSAITGGGSAPKKTKGRGFRDEAAAEADRNARMSAPFDSLDSEGGPGPERCSVYIFPCTHSVEEVSFRTIEGWIILVTGVHEEAQEDDLQNAFGDFGEIKNLHLNLDRRTGFVKGYALIEFEKFEEAQRAISEMDGAELLTQIMNVDWAFSKGPFRRRNIRRRYVFSNSQMTILVPLFPLITVAHQDIGLGKEISITSGPSVQESKEEILIMAACESFWGFALE
ncbi:hypothetical protein SASPL_125210 [Salvia splendens]|uniref:RNA-binding protein 8A n=1 Tax=Salvia splendens TaxID=180675 RepID=A0A8X8XJJ9_SALSN|nr:hypothetical protein SASPL_125210 [Salvia splendens]